MSSTLARHPVAMRTLAFPMLFAAASLVTVACGAGTTAQKDTMDPSGATARDLATTTEPATTQDTTAVTPDPVPVSPKEVGLFFPKSSEPTRDVMSALGGGRLFVRDGCIRMGSRQGSSDVVVWPYEYSLGRGENGKILVLNEDGEAEASIGDEVRVGGGQITRGEAGPTPEAARREFMEQRKNLEVPDQCRGSLWGAAPGMRVVEQG